MTYEELIEELNFTIEIAEGYRAYIKALRAVVELHKPETHVRDGLCCSYCSYTTYEDYYGVSYPCNTIAAIEEQLT